MMKKLSVLMLLSLLIPGSQYTPKEQVFRRFQDTDGLLYYIRPTAGRMVHCFFFPYSKQNVKVDPNFVQSKDVTTGIGFTVVNGHLFNKLLKDKKHQITISEAGYNLENVFLIPKTRIYFYLEPFMGDEFIEDGIRSHTLNLKNHKILLEYNFSRITVNNVSILSTAEKLPD